MADDKKTPLFLRVKRYLTSDIWDVSMSDIVGVKAKGITLLRIIITTVTGILKKRILVQASSLSYATLLAIGPILAITILFSSMFFRDKEDVISEKIVDAVGFVMPAFQHIDVLTERERQKAAEQRQAEADAASSHDGAAKDGESAQEDGDKAKINPAVTGFINKILQGSKAGGAIGVAAMLMTCLLLCINMESAMNFIWGATRGRKWVDRIVFYFSMIFFGSVGTMFGMTFLATSQLSSYVKDIPFISDYASWVTYAAGMGIMTCVLAFFYKFIPTTRVKWHAAFIGAVIIMFALMLNNKLSFIYISYILKQSSFYGYLAIVAVAMFSLYIFWMLILMGGQIAYAVQYVDFISNEESWNKMGQRARQLSALAVFAEVSKAFYDTSEAPTVDSLSMKLKLPKVVIRACIEWLEEKNLVSPTESIVEGDDDVYFKPSVSPDTVSLSRFFDILTVNKDDECVMKTLSGEEPAVAKALESFSHYADSTLPSKTVKDIL